MGTRYSAVFYAAPPFNADGLAADLFAAVNRVDQQMSTWKPHSDLSQLNAAPVDIWVDLPQQLLTVLQASLHYERMTQGAFDIGVGSLVRAAGFGPPPSSSTLDADTVTSRAVTHASLILDAANGRARKVAPLALDLSGIAKGFAVDEMAAVMTTHGVRDWLVGIDGEMRAKGSKPGGERWAVAHERPDRQVREAIGVIELADMAVATSGNYRHWRDVDGQIISHTIDPATNKAVTNAVSSATVLAPTCRMADAMATACMVLGLKVGMQCVQRSRVDAIFVTEDGEVVSSFS